MLVVAELVVGEHAHRDFALRGGLDVLGDGADMYGRRVIDRQVHAELNHDWTGCVDASHGRCRGEPGGDRAAQERLAC
jgi:hypothetical protein